MASLLTQTAKEKVSPSDVISALERIKNAAAGDTPEGEDGADPRVRSTLSNLIFLSNDLKKTEPGISIDSLVSELCLSHPSRFLVASVRSGTNGLETAVSSQCVIAHSGAHVCSEEVYISVDEDSSEYLSNYLLSLLVPDVPAVLVVLGDVGVEGETFHSVLQQVAGISDRIIFDSSSFSQLDQSARTLRRGDFEQPLILCDLTWVKIARWRELIAEQFESQTGVKTPDNISRIDIHFSRQDESSGSSPSRGIPVEALLLSTWIIDSLCAEVRSVLPLPDGGMEIVLKSKQKFKLQLLPVEGSSVQLTPISKVEFSMGHGEVFCGLSISRINEEDAEVSIRFSSLASGEKDSCELNVRHVSFPDDDSRILLKRTLNQPSNSESFQRIFEKMLTLTEDDDT